MDRPIFRGDLKAPLVVDALGWRRVLGAGTVQPPEAFLSRGLEVHPDGGGEDLRVARSRVPRAFEGLDRVAGALVLGEEPARLGVARISLDRGHERRRRVRGRTRHALPRVGSRRGLRRLDPRVGRGTSETFEQPRPVDQRALVLTFTGTAAQTVYVLAVNDPRMEGDRVVSIGHSVASSDPLFDQTDVRNVEVTVHDDDTPAILVTAVVPGTSTEDGVTLVLEGDATTRVTDQIRV